MKTMIAFTVLQDFFSVLQEIFSFYEMFSHLYTKVSRLYEKVSGSCRFFLFYTRKFLVCMANIKIFSSYFDPNRLSCYESPKYQKKINISIRGKNILVLRRIRLSFSP